ncbi:unnamed protein product [Ectocarpus sp. 12 AP-2014]
MTARLLCGYSNFICRSCGTVFCARGAPSYPSCPSRRALALMVRGSVLLVADAPRTTHRQCRVIPTHDTGRQIVFLLCRRESRQYGAVRRCWWESMSTAVQLSRSKLL